MSWYTATTSSYTHIYKSTDRQTVGHTDEYILIQFYINLLYLSLRLAHWDVNNELVHGHYFELHTYTNLQTDGHTDRRTDMQTDVYRMYT